MVQEKKNLKRNNGKKNKFFQIKKKPMCAALELKASNKNSKLLNVIAKTVFMFPCQTERK